jgi:hypothetical protein
VNISVNVSIILKYMVELRCEGALGMNSDTACRELLEHSNKQSGFIIIIMNNNSRMVDLMAFSDTTGTFLCCHFFGFQ